MDLGKGVKLEMVLIPAGEFMMGSDTDHSVVETPRHQVRITKPFYLGKYPVTQEQWETVMATGSNFGPSRINGPKNPVGHVSWNNCQMFLKRLNGGKFSLPTEAQWEYACRAGSTTRYCFGDTEAGLAEYAWYAKNSDKTTHPVGEKEPNAWGLYDMHGNVREWCQDWYGAGYYAKSPTDDPAGPTTGKSRVIRGSSWNDPAGRCRSAARDFAMFGYRDDRLGFRVSLVPQEAVAQTPPSESATPLKLQPVHPQTIESGKPLAVAVSSENPAAWKGKLRYTLASNASRGARIDPQSGEFSWTPPLGQAAGKYDVTVSVQAADGQTAQTTFIVTVIAPLEKELGGSRQRREVGNGPDSCGRVSDGLARCGSPATKSRSTACGSPSRSTWASIWLRRSSGRP